MTNKPLYNAILALGYIVAVATFMYYAHDIFGPLNGIFGIAAFLSLFVLSAAIMGYLFLYQPLVFMLQGDTKGGTILFLKTLGAFALIALFLFAVVKVLLS